MSYAIRQAALTANTIGDPMMKDHVTAEEVKRALAWRINTGMYQAGEPLPPVRQLAEEFGANRNTVNKACRALQQLGILGARPGRRSPVVAHIANGASAMDLVRSQARDVVWQAMSAGIGRDQLRAELALLVEEVYGVTDLKIRFLECNPYDSETLSADLSRLTGVPIGAGLLDEATRDVEAFAQTYDLVVTTFHHLAEVTRMLAICRDRIIGVDTRPSSTSRLGIARLTLPRIGLVCTLPGTARMLEHIILSYQPQASVDIALIDSPDSVRHLAQECDHLVVTHNCAVTLEELTGRRADVVIEFRIDDQSIEYLRERIRAARLESTATLRPGRYA